MKHILTLLLFVWSLSGCASFDPLKRADVGIDWSHHPADWPTLTIDEHIEDYGSVQNICSVYFGKPAAGMVYEACAVVRFDKRTCTVYIRDDVDLPAARRHEEDGHCHGYDHPNSQRNEKAWAKWKQLHRD